MPCGGSSRCGGGAGIRCYTPTLTQADSDATTNYHEWLSFTVPGGDLKAGDTITITLDADILNGTAFNPAFFVNQLDFGGISQANYPTDHFVPWATGATYSMLYRILFFFLPAINPGDLIARMLDWRAADGPYNIGLGTAAAGGGIHFTAFNFGTFDSTVDQVVKFSARWTHTSGITFPTAGAGAHIAPQFARIVRTSCGA